MAVEAYIPDNTEFDGGPIDSPALITLYDPDGPAPSGSMTTSAPLDEGQTGRLVFRGLRGDKAWSVICPDVRVMNKTALGCEFSLASAPRREPLEELNDARGRHTKAFEEHFDIR